MAYSPSPQHSPLQAAGGGPLNDRRLTPTPPPQPLSKRDKRRTALSDKLNDLTASFTQHRDGHYRRQLQALQIDMNLIMRADPYTDAPLDDSADDVAEMVAAAAASNNASSGLQEGGAGQAAQRRADSDMAALAGRWYAKFVEEVNNAMEERDTALTMLENKYERSLDELYQTNRYKIRLAQEEHRQLSGTIRERLIQSIEQKKARLMREKEQLDIADSNALLLHPNQFSITNPTSPGGVHSSRKTRNTRHRPGDTEDLGAVVAAGDGSHKRKRKGIADENDAGSPAPLGRPTEAGIASPYRDARARLAGTQIDAPLYSIDRLFTEKELSMHINTAAVAAHNYFAEIKARENGRSELAKEDDANGDEDGTGSGLAGTTRDGDGETETVLAAPEMERAANQSHHATRSTRNAVASGLSLLGDLAMSEKHPGPSSSLPMILPASFITKTGQAPPPPPLRGEEAEDDLAQMERMMRSSAGATNQKLLGELLGPLGASSYHNNLMTALPLAAGGGEGALGGASGLMVGGVAMSAQSSTAGFSEMGGVAMSRQEGTSTGTLMKRSASGAGFSLSGSGGVDGKRVRNR